MPAWLIERLTSPTELDTVLAIEQACFTNPWTRAMYLSEMENPNSSFLYVARNASREIVGFCAFWRVFDELHINNLAVAPTDRRSGIASALLAHVLNEGARLGARRATLEVRRSNEPALRLYWRFGFDVAGVRRNYYSHPIEDALILWCEELDAGRS